MPFSIMNSKLVLKDIYIRFALTVVSDFIWNVSLCLHVTCSTECHRFIYKVYEILYLVYFIGNGRSVTLLVLELLILLVNNGQKRGYI